ncbi:DNA replication helicase [Wolffia australiana]
MGPRKRPSSSSSSSRKPSQAVRQSQPAKFGIQHFFERHTQATAAAVDSADAHFDGADSQLDPPEKAEEENPSPISPEATRAPLPKRARFSPGMLIKQSQDDGIDEITWRISPINQRLRSFTTKVFQDEASPPIKTEQKLSSLRPCSEEKNSETTSENNSFPKQEECFENVDSNTFANTGQQTPFRTPPSMPYAPLESVGGDDSNSTSTLVDSMKHRKTLLELLDEVEDEISNDDSTGKTREPSATRNADKALNFDSLTDDHHKPPVYTGPENSCNENLLVLEVTEEQTSSGSSHRLESLKVLRLLNENSGEERSLHLRDEWFYSQIGPGDCVNVIGEFDGHGRCLIDRNQNLIIVHPHILVSGTRVASSFSCPRRTVLDERFKVAEYCTPAMMGTLLHQIFQAGLLKDNPTPTFMEEYAGTLLQQNIESLYACGVSETETYLKLVREIPRILRWIKTFRDEQPLVNFGQYEGERSISLTEVIDIEEMVQTRRYGLKGMIDASLHLKMKSVDGGLMDKIVPFELKTGKATTGQAAMDHRAQVILYSLLMSERYPESDVDSGLIYYLFTDQTLGIKVQRSDLVGIIMRRNELATDILRASTFQILPPMLRSPSICRSCRHLNTCAIYHKAYGGDQASSGLDEFDSFVNHLSPSHEAFLRQWDRLIDLDSRASSVGKREALHLSDSSPDHNSLSSIVLDMARKYTVDESSRNGRFIYHFINKNVHSEVKNGLQNNLDCGLRCGDYVVLRAQTGHISVGNGVIMDIGPFNVSVALPRRLRIPGLKCSQDETALAHQSWRIEKDEVASSYAVMRYNIVQLFLQNRESFRLTKMIVDLEAPMFDRGGIFSQDQAVACVRSEKTLNDDQRKAIHKILSAKDYALILGMPGTGKTSTMVHAVKALSIRGASILLTSYTNSAVDNLLLKLKAQGIDFIRIGRQEAVHVGIREHCLSGKLGLEAIKRQMECVKVVGATCLGINHPLLSKKKFDICIMDEAGQISLPITLGPLMLAKRFVLVGDHYQLPPLVRSAEAQENGMGISLFCRLSEAHPQAIAALQSQYRMCAGIMELSNALIYGNRLRCGSPEVANAKLIFSGSEPLSWLKEILDPEKPVIFVNTDELPALEMKAKKAISNPAEANIVAAVVEELMKRNISGDDLGVITPYNAQADLIRGLVGPGVEVHTIDKYQGRDKDCILLSFVRSCEKHFGSSLLGDWHRINVALTRPKKKLIMVGSCGTLARMPLLKLLIEKVRETGSIISPSIRDMGWMRQFVRCSHD